MTPIHPMKKSSLHRLGFEHGTDKATVHDYCDVYAELFPVGAAAFVRKVLEIGIAGGASLAMWRDYFDNAEIYGIDHTAECAEAGRRHGKRIHTMVAEATDPAFWEGDWPPRDADVVIDDASHFVGATAKTFMLGFGHLKSGGYWVIEDTHAGYDEAYQRDNLTHGLPEGWNTNEVFANKAISRLHEFGQGQIGKQIRPDTDIKWMTFHKSMIVICKR